MTPDQIFSIVNLVALVAWVLLAVFPGRRAVTDVVAGTAVPAALAALYAVDRRGRLERQPGRLLLARRRSPRCSATRGCCWRGGCTTWRSTC